MGLRSIKIVTSLEMIGSSWRAIICVGMLYSLILHFKIMHKWDRNWFHIKSFAICHSLYQYNKDDFLVWFITNCVLNYKFTSKKREEKLFNHQLLFVSLFVCMLFKSLVWIKIQIESRLHNIDINDDDCRGDNIQFMKIKTNFF